MYTADFETNNHEDDCRVWAWGICDIDTLEFNYGNSIESFIEWIKQKGHQRYYFHNLKFDGNFICSYLLNNGWEHVLEKKLEKNQFKTLISDKGQFYTITLCFHGFKGKAFTVEIYDSLKLIPFSVAEVARNFNLPLSKGKIDYDEVREIGHELTEEEIEYLKGDVKIMAMALQIFFKQGLDSMTIGSNALRFYKKQISTKSFERRFPVPYYDAEVRQSYKGAWTYLNPRFARKTIDVPGIVLDENSMYPWVMKEKPLPYGEGISFKGKYKKDKAYPLYIQMITCQFELKEGYFPTIQLKHNLAFIPTEYLTSSKGEDITMCLTCVDLELFLEHYHVYNLEYHSGWKFKASCKLFSDYIDYWMNVKIEADKAKNKALRTIAKLYLNNLYGKLAKNPLIANKVPYLDDKGIVRYKLMEYEEVAPIYVPAASFITAWARDKIIRSAMAVKDRFIYADTDSLHLIGEEIPEGLEIDAYKLGAWKVESRFTRARFIRAKSYAEVIDGEVKITCAGLPKAAKTKISFEDFRPGFIYPESLKSKAVKGGIVLHKSTFEIKV